MAHFARAYSEEIDLSMNTLMLRDSRFPSAAQVNSSELLQVQFQSHCWNHNLDLDQFSDRAF